MFRILKTSLQARLTLAFALVLLIPTVITTAYSLNSASDALVQNTTEQELNIANRSKDHVEDFLANMKSDLLFLSKDPGSKDFANAQNADEKSVAVEDLHDLFSNFLTQSSVGYLDLQLVDVSGREIIHVNDSTGTPVILPDSSLENLENQSYVQETLKLKLGEAYFSSFDLNTTAGKLDQPLLPVIRYSTPLYSSDGKLAGLVILKSHADAIFSDLIPDEGDESTFLFDSRGNYWLNPDNNKLYGTFLGTGASFTQDQPQDAAYILPRDNGTLFASADQPDAFQTFIHITPPDEEGVSWTLVNSRPINTILGAIAQARLTIVGISLVAFILSVAIAGFIARSIVTPIRKLTSAAAEISQDRWDTAFPASGSSDEVGQLTSSFSTMTNAVRQRNTELATLNNSLSEQAKELKRANAVARDSIRLKSEFMSTMSHELRTPLNAIIGFSGIMLEGMGGEMDDEAHHMVQRIDSNSQRLLHLINDVLDLAKIEAGRMELSSKPFSPRDLVERWRAETSVLAEKNGLQFKVNVAPNVPEVLVGDPDRITQVAVNLLSNAFKFTKQGGVLLNVEQQEDNWLIKVTDTGIGIPPHALNYIFEEFRQVDGTSTRVYGGSGLGLSISRNICRMMGGNIRVTSELGKGSIFTVTLPVNTPEMAQFADAAVKASALEPV